jgi:hypothetical protein
MSIELDPETEELQILDSIHQEALSCGDADDIPMYEGPGYCCYWGAYPDSPIPDQRLFIVFNRKPKDDDEAMQVAKEHFGYE